jgi:hypothetical protein
MRRRGIPKEYTEWIHNKVEGRHTQIIFDDFTAAPRVVPRGLDQGCPLSGILFQFYNADLLEIPDRNNGEDTIAFVDNATAMAEGSNLEESNAKIEDIMEKQGGGLDWSDTHDSKYELQKFALVGFTRHREPDPTGKKATQPLQ